ncbi:MULTISPECIES: hypothetical protein [unclassified Rickettsia]|nr:MULTISPECIES: hypothetical protein [unclassified Rickettsia]
MTFGNNDIDKTGASEIEKALKANTTLIFLNVPLRGSKIPRL